ncbi:MAG: hypothetical protein ACXWUF_19025, partial [Methylomagnum sp.]
MSQFTPHPWGQRWGSFAKPLESSPATHPNPAKKPPRQNNHGIYMGRGQAKRIQNKEHDNAKNLSYSDKSNSAFDAVL